MKIGLLVGSLSKKAYSLKVANYLTVHAEGARLIQLNYDFLPMYNPDLEEEPPVEWTALRAICDQLDGLLVVTPEYNFSIPGGLKNVLDVLSVPTPHPHLFHKPAMVITVSSGERGGMIANAHLTQSLTYQGMKVLANYVTVGMVQQVFKGTELVDAGVGKLLQNQLAAFVEFIGRANPEPTVDLSSQFVYRDGNLTVLDNQQRIIAQVEGVFSERVLIIKRVTVTPENRGQGWATKAMDLLMALVVQGNGTVRAQCSFAKDYLKRHSEYDRYIDAQG